MCNVHIDHGTRHMLDWDNTLRHGLGLNHPLVCLLWELPADWSKTNIPPFIEPIREGVRKSGLMSKFVMQLFSKTCHDWLNKGICHDMNQSGMVLVRKSVVLRGIILWGLHLLSQVSLKMCKVVFNGSYDWPFHTTCTVSVTIEYHLGDSIYFEFAAIFDCLRTLSEST